MNDAENLSKIHRELARNLLSRSLRRDLTSNRNGILLDDWSIGQRLRENSEALRILGRAPAGHRLISQMMECSKRSPCNSPLCPACKFAAMQRVEGDLTRTYESVPEKNLFWVTILISPVCDGKKGIDREIKRTRIKLRNLLSRLNRCRSKKKIRYSIRGFFEFDTYLLSNTPPRNAGTGLTRDYKSIALREMGFGETALGARSHRRAFHLLHLHGVVSAPSSGALRKGLRTSGQYPGSYQVKVKPLDVRFDKATNLRRLTAYMLKTSPRYGVFNSGHGQRFRPYFRPKRMRRYFLWMNDWHFRSLKLYIGRPNRNKK